MDSNGLAERLAAALFGLKAELGQHMVLINLIKEVEALESKYQYENKWVEYKNRESKLETQVCQLGGWVMAYGELLEHSPDVFLNKALDFKPELEDAWRYYLDEKDKEV